MNDIVSRLAGESRQERLIWLGNLILATLGLVGFVLQLGSDWHMSDWHMGNLGWVYFGVVFIYQMVTGQIIRTRHRRVNTEDLDRPGGPYDHLHARHKVDQ